MGVRVAETLMVTDLVSGALFVTDLVDEAVPVAVRVTLAVFEDEREGDCEVDGVWVELGLAEGLLELVLDADAAMLDEGVLEGVTSAYTCTACRQALLLEFSHVRLM